MRVAKVRLTVTVDPALVEAGTEAVAAGHADSLSAWVNLALAERIAKERRLHALGEAVAAYEAGFGRISAAELETQERVDQRTASVIRGTGRRSAGRPRPAQRPRSA